MKKTKLLALGISVLLMFSLFSGCAKKDSPTTPSTEGEKTEEDKKEADVEQGEADAEPVKITFFNTSAEVNNEFDELFATYHDLNPNVTIELIPTPVGGAQIEKFQSLLASGNPATIANLDPGFIQLYNDKFLDLEPMKAEYEEIAQPGAIEGALLDGKFLGIPYTVQGYGLLYNTRVVEEAIGKTFDPKTIKTRDDLEALFEEIAATGKPPMLLHGADWSLGAHYLGLTYSLQSKKVAENLEWVNGLKDGSADLASNDKFTGLMDTFDLLSKYNIRAEDALVADHDRDSLDFAKGETAFYFMGDWLWSTIGTMEDRDQEFGMIPVPISNDPSDDDNMRVAVSQPKLMAIDDSGSTPEQQAAAKDFLKWMLTSDEGHEMLTVKMGFTMPYKNVEAKSTNVLATVVSEYIAEGNTIDIGVINNFPADYWAKTGASMQKYIVDKIDRAGLAEEVQDYWKSLQ
ncbi:MAG TPA: carbohydrate ABC transporter substrate-binding protein [Epulopiscium sp.]|nr:carbohydrate ABC transporter substrate-binding protein [Candidatus Epulonipiscium sp.]